jgi:hypothetical protein
LIPPGTVIGNQAPLGWSHLVIKTHTRPGSGDLSRVDATTAQLASLLFMTTLANVEPEPAPGPRRYYLSRVATGLGTQINGRDVVLSPDTQASYGANLGLLSRLVLSGAYDRQREVRMVARSRTMALYDTPALMLRAGRHRPVVLRYVLLVDPPTGRLDTLVWLIDRDGRGGYQGPSSAIQWLPPGKLEDCRLHVDGHEFVLGVATEKAFASSQIPQGQWQLDFPADIRVAAGQPFLSAASAQLMEYRLREALARARVACRTPPSPTVSGTP